MAQVVEKRTQEVTAEPSVVTEHPQRVYEKKKTIFRAYQVIWYILAVIEILLLFRVALKALGANPAHGFTAFVYNVSDPLALPFSGIFGITVSRGSVLEWSTLIGMLVYAIVAYGIVYLFQFINPVNPEEVE